MSHPRMQYSPILPSISEIPPSLTERRIPASSEYEDHAALISGEGNVRISNSKPAGHSLTNCLNDLLRRRVNSVHDA
jgi:hypothetical protein